MTINAYLPRIADQELRERLSWSGAVLIEGPRACGKTELAQQVAESMVFLDTDKRARDMIAIDPRLVLEGKTPRLVDEWQVEPAIWNHVRRAVDERVGRGHFILTGSAVPPDDVTRHPGTGRISRLRLRPMSLFELGHSTGRVSLREVIDGGPVRSPEAPLSAARLAGFADRVDTDRCGEPAALGVIVGTGYGYKRRDGVSVIPIGALGP